MEQYMLPCLNKKFFGFECLGCGIQRSLVLVLRGDFIAAFQRYPAIYPLLALALVLAYTSFFKLKHSSKVISFLAISSVVLILVNYTLKHFI